MTRKMLSIEEQIAHMKSKNIKFNIMNESQAESYLKWNSYYFKIKAYAKNFDMCVNGNGKRVYCDLEFAYLKELAMLDMLLRKIILALALDLEHFMKTRLIYDCTRNRDEDGISIISEVFTAEYIEKLETNNRGKNACSDLIANNTGKWAIWNFVEILSFSGTIKLYEAFYIKHKEYKDNISNLLYGAKFLRNAAAHNNCLINSLVKSYTPPQKNMSLTLYNTLCNTDFVEKRSNIAKSNECAENYTVTPNRLKKQMSNLVINDFISLLVAHSRCVTSEGVRKNRLQELKTLFEGRVVLNSDYFKNNRALQNSYKITKKFIDYLDKNRI